MLHVCCIQATYILHGLGPCASLPRLGCRAHHSAIELLPAAPHAVRRAGCRLRRCCCRRQHPRRRRSRGVVPQMRTESLAQMCVARCGPSPSTMWTGTRQQGSPRRGEDTAACGWICDDGDGGDEGCAGLLQDLGRRARSHRGRAGIEHQHQ